jgi:DNA-binding NarL/FixJ family response regulator
LSLPAGHVPRPSVLVADGDPYDRTVVREALERSGDFAIAAEVGDGFEAVELALRLRPDLILLQAALPGLDGLEVTRRILAAHPQAQVAIVAREPDPRLQRQALRAGAIGFVSVGGGAEAIVRAARGVAWQSAAFRLAAGLADAHALEDFPGG